MTGAMSLLYLLGNARTAGLQRGAGMGMMVLLLDGDALVGSVDAATAGRLLDLGVATVSLLRDETSVSLVLDGWAFDPATSGAAAAAIFGAAKVFRPVLHTVLTPDLEPRANGPTSAGPPPEWGSRV